MFIAGSSSEEIVHENLLENDESKSSRMGKRTKTSMTMIQTSHKRINWRCILQNQTLMGERSSTRWQLSCQTLYRLHLRRWQMKGIGRECSKTRMSSKEFKRALYHQKLTKRISYQVSSKNCSDRPLNKITFSQYLTGKRVIYPMSNWA